MCSSLACAQGFNQTKHDLRKGKSWQKKWAAQSMRMPISASTGIVQIAVFDTRALQYVRKIVPPACCEYIFIWV